jgi:arylformamidase
MLLYREFTCIEALNEQYLPSAKVMDTHEIFARWRVDSISARTLLDVKCGLRFGPTIDEYVDIFPCGTPKKAPVHMFIHGGNWHSFSPKDFLSSRAAWSSVASRSS